MCLFKFKFCQTMFGDHAGTFEAELTAALLCLNSAGIFSEQIETEVIIAP